MKVIKYTIQITILLSLISCNMIDAGAFSGWNTITFPLSLKQFDIAMDSLYKMHPDYIAHEKWKNYSNEWIKQKYVPKKTFIFYFASSPEEMYYVTLVDPGLTSHPEYVRIAIRGVETGDGRWKQNKQYKNDQKTRIEKRFHDEIILKLEKYTKTKSYIE